MQNVTPTVIAVLALELAPAAAFGFAGGRVTAAVSHWPRLLRLLIPGVFCLPYAVVALHQHIFRWEWMILYIFLPILVAALLMQASVADPEQRGNWRDALILLTLGLAVDLRWLDSAWPDGLRGLGNLLLLDVGLYGFLGIRHLSGTGFDFHFRWSDWKIGSLLADPAHPTEIAFFDRGPMDSTKLEMAGSWGAYWYNGYIYSSEIARGLDVLELQPNAMLTQNELDAAKLVKVASHNPQDQQRLTWPASFVVARAYLDQLERSRGLSADRISAARTMLASAERTTSRAALVSLAAAFDRDAASSRDAVRVRALAGVVRALAK